MGSCSPSGVEVDEDLAVASRHHSGQMAERAFRHASGTLGQRPHSPGRATQVVEFHVGRLLQGKRAERPPQVVEHGIGVVRGHAAHPCKEGVPQSRLPERLPLVDLAGDGAGGEDILEQRAPRLGAPNDDPDVAGADPVPDKTGHLLRREFGLVALSGSQQEAHAPRFPAFPGQRRVV